MALSKQDKIDLLREMMLMRHFEEKAQEMYEARKVGGFLHLYIGQEAVASGFTWPIEPQDYIIGAYREHGQALARCAEPRSDHGRALRQARRPVRRQRRVHASVQPQRRFLGGTAIVGGGLPIAVGAGFAINYREEDAICLCFFGDGAVNEGLVPRIDEPCLALEPADSFHLREQSLWHGHGGRARVGAYRTCSGGRSAMAWKCRRSMGMDLLSVIDMAERCINCVRTERRPIFVEAVTYRYRGHSMSDPGRYRSREEVEEWRRRDPIMLFGNVLASEGTLSKGDIEAMSAECERVIDEAVAFAEASEPPSPESLHEHVYA